MNILEFRPGNDLCQYVKTALWSSTGDDEEPLDENYSFTDIHKDSLKIMRGDISLFRDIAGGLLDDLDDTGVAHDFWLTRNGHGTGFWDGDYPEEIGEQLTELSEMFGEQYLLVGDDGMVHCYPT